MKTCLRRRNVFINESQNDDKKTTARVYSLRAKNAPPISTPLKWGEVEEALVLFSDTNEGIARGDGDGILRPGEVNPRIFSHNGIADIPPLATDTSLLYVQRQGTKIRVIEPGSRVSGTLSLTASHLLRARTVVSWCFQPSPEPVVWIVLDNGALLSVTYERESGTIGWARHDTDGFYESVACIRYDGRDAVHALVRRVINAAELPELDYLVSLLREDSQLMEFWPVSLQGPLPVVPVPLLAPDPDAVLDLGAAFREHYDAAAYDVDLNYRRPVPPPLLSPENDTWVRVLLDAYLAPATA